MRSILILIIFCYFQTISFSQYDVTLNAIFNPNTVPSGQTTYFELTFCNLTPTALSVPTGGVGVQVNWGTGYSGDVAPTGAIASLFNWFDIGNGWYGVNNAPITFPTCGVLSFEVIANAPNSGGSQSSYSSQIFPPGTDLTPGNNNGSQTLVVTAPLPIKLVSFEGRSTSCDQINLAWQTVSERNNDYIEIQRSSNGIDFVTLEKLSGTNRSDLNSYSYYDRNELVGGTKYYYRLKQVDFDGKFEYHKVIAVEHICASEPLALGIYPNPAIDKVNITLTGLSVPTEVNLSILNNEGSLVRTLTINSATNNEFYLNDLPAGVYHLKSEGFEETLTARFIRIQ